MVDLLFLSLEVKVPIFHAMANSYHIIEELFESFYIAPHLSLQIVMFQGKGECLLEYMHGNCNLPPIDC
jgi:hypothetical protein